MTEKQVDYGELRDEVDSYLASIEYSIDTLKSFMFCVEDDIENVMDGIYDGDEQAQAALVNLISTLDSASIYAGNAVDIFDKVITPDGEIRNAQA